jgi:hypothetical protein
LNFELERAGMAGKRHLSPGDVLGLIESVARRYPRAWQLAHSTAPERHDFAILVARELFTESGGTIGGNWRRAVIGDFSMDGLSIENPADGRYYFRDYIVGAGGPHARISYDAHPFGVPGSYPPLETHGTYGPVDPGSGTTKPTPEDLLKLLPDRGRMMAAGRRLHAYYKAPEGLQRELGLWTGSEPDFEGIAAWRDDVWLRAVLSGKSDAEAFDEVIKQIRRSDEWRGKHPGETP